VAEGVIDEFEHGKIGGVPVWGVSVLIAAAAIGFVAYRNHKKNLTATTTTTDTVPATDTTNGVSDAGNTDLYGLPSGPIGDYLSQNPTNPAYPTALTPQGLPAPITNLQWSRIVEDYLVGLGADPTLVANALSTYLAGGNLSTQMQAIINEATRYLGAPPEGVLPVTVGQTAPPPTGTNSNPTPTSLSAPTGLKVTQNVYKAPSNAVISFSWNAVNGATSYVVWFDDPYHPHQFTQEVSGTSATFENIQALGSQVRLNVQAKNSFGTSGTSSVTTRAAGTFVGKKPPTDPSTGLAA
jgi:hypothetical protein